MESFWSRQDSSLLSQVVALKAEKHIAACDTNGLLFSLVSWTSQTLLELIGSLISALLNERSPYQTATRAIFSE